jgi:hypothetical protein
MDSSGSVDLLDESPSQSFPSSPPLPPPRSTSRPLFFSGQEEQSPDPLPVTGEGDDAGGSVSDPAPSELSEWSDDDPSSSAGSSAPDKPAQLLSKRQMRQTAETAVKVGTGMAHTVAAKSDAQKAVGLYLADDDDAVAIGHPLADLMHRRGDIVGGKLSPDANDFLRSLMGVAGYFTKQIQKVAVVRQLEAGAAAGEVQHLPTDA